MSPKSFALALTVAGLAAILLPSSLPAQITFQRTYGGAKYDIGYSVQQTADGGYIIAGSTSSFGASMFDAYLIKTDAVGDTQWTRTLGDGYWDDAYSVQQTNDGGYIASGGGLGSYAACLAKLNANGDTQWTRAYRDRTYASSVEQTADGGYVLAGETGSADGGNGDIYLARTDARGDTLWTRTFGDTNSNWANSVRQTKDGGFVAACHTGSVSTGYTNIYLVRTDANGDTLWTKVYSHQYGFDEGNSVQQTADGGYIIAGQTDTRSANRDDAYLIKTDADGDTLWTGTYGGRDFENYRSIQNTADGGYIIAGETQSISAKSFNTDVYLVKTDVQGRPEWTRTFGASGWDDAYSVQQTSDGGYIVAGSTSSFGAGSSDVYLIKTDSLGRLALGGPPAILLTCIPNPFTSSTRIDLKPQAPSSRPTLLRVYDAGGRIVFTRLVGTSSFVLEASSWPAGIYLVRVNSGPCKGTAKLVLQR
jgi:hypothetical protein